MSYRKRLGGEHQREGEHDHVGWFAPMMTVFPVTTPMPRMIGKMIPIARCARPQSEVDRTLRLIRHPRLHRRDHLR